MRTAVVTGVIVAVVAAILLIGNNVEDGPNPFVSVGLVNGAIFGLVALGLVLVYKGTRVFNFAQGEFGTIAAYLVFLTTASEGPLTGLNLPLGVGIVIGLVGAVLVGLLMERLIVRPLLSSPRITLLVATIAIALLFIGIEILVFRVDPLNLTPVMEPQSPSGDIRGITLFGLPIAPQRLIAVGVLLALGVLLAYFFSRTDLGLAVLATSQDAFATRVVGIGVERMSRFIWGGAALLGGIAGILYVPIAGALLPGIMTSNILIPAFTGAVLGGMTSLPGAFVGGLVIGLVQSLSLWATGHFTVGGKLIGEIVPGGEQVSIILALLIVLMIRPQGLLGTEA